MSDGNVKLKYEVDKSQIDAAIKSLQDIQKEAGLSEDATKKMSKNSGDSISDLISGFKTFAATLGGLAIAAEIKKWITAFVEFSDEMVKARRTAAQLSTETGYALDAITVKALSLSKAFNTDYNETLKTAMVIARNFGITQQDALSRIEDGFKRGANATGGYLEALQVGAIRAKTAGYSFDQLNSVVVQLVQSGQRVGVAMRTIFDPKNTEEGGKYALILERAKAGLASLNTEQQAYYDKMTKWLELDERVIGSELELSNAWSLTTKELKSTWYPAWSEFLQLFMSDELKDRLAHLNAALNTTNLNPLQARMKELDLIEKIKDVQSDLDFAVAENKRLEEKGLSTNQERIDKFKEQLRQLNAQKDVIGDVVKRQAEAAKITADEDKNNKSVQRQKDENDEIKEKLRLIKELTGLQSTDAKDTGFSATETTLEKILDLTDKINQKHKEDIGLGKDNPLQKRVTDNIKYLKEQSDQDTKFTNIVQKIKEQGYDSLNNDEKAFFEKKKQYYGEEGKLAKNLSDTKEYLEKHGVAMVGQVISDIMTLKSKQTDMELQQLDQVTQNKLSNEKLTAAQRKKIEDDAAKQRSVLLNKQAKQDHDAAIINSIVKTAEAVVSMLTAPPPVNFVLAGIVAGMGAIETALIAAQPVPKYAKGGPVIGASHLSGGVQIEAEGGEYMINKIAVKRYKPLIEKINRLELEPNFLINGQKSTGVNITVDSPELLKELKRLNTTNINIDEQGFMVRQWNIYGSHQRQINKYFK